MKRQNLFLEENVWDKVLNKSDRYVRTHVILWDFRLKGLPGSL